MDKELELSIISKCNRKCIYCNFVYFKNKKQDTPELSTIFKSIKNAAKEKIKYLAIVGGEPTLHKNLNEILYIAKKNKFKDIALVTNGIKLSQKKYLDKLVRFGMTSVTLNLPHFQIKKFEYLTGKTGSFSKIIKAIENLNEKKILITAFIVINRLNYKELIKIADFYFKMKIKNFVFAYIRYTGRAETNANKLKIGMKNCLPYLKRAFDYLDSKKVTVSFENFLPCILKGYEKYMSDFYEEISKDLGKIYHKGEKYYDDLYKISYRDNIKSLKCRTCKYYSNCVGLAPGYFKLFGDKEIKPLNYV